MLDEILVKFGEIFRTLSSPLEPEQLEKSSRGGVTELLRRVGVWTTVGGYNPPPQTELLRYRTDRSGDDEHNKVRSVHFYHSRDEVTM